MIAQLFRSLFHRDKVLLPKPDPIARAQSEIAELRSMVYDLLVEVEAIRETLLKSPFGSDGPHSPYAIAYRDTAFRTHDASGCTGDKLLAQFYPSSPKRDDWRECLFMHRLGFSTDAIARYMREAEAAETYT